MDASLKPARTPVPLAAAEKSAAICTVATPVHKRLAAYNHRLVQRLNPGRPVRWSIAYNDDLHLATAKAQALLVQAAGAGGSLSRGERERIVQAEKEKHFDPGALEDWIPDADIRPGPTLEELVKRSQPAGGDKAARVEHRRLMEKYLGSYHHAAALQLAIAAAQERYVIIMDPDFYVIRPGWIDEVLGHMAETGLAVFGAPWSPRWYQKFRDFPCSHLMVVDQALCPLTPGLFEPDLVGGGRRFASEIWTNYSAAQATDRPAAMRKLLRNPLAAIAQDIRQRTTIGSARDTGFRMRLEFQHRSRLKSEILTAVFRPEDGFMPPAVAGPQLNPLVEGVFPERWRYLPRKPGYVSQAGFKELGYPDFRSLGWEEFLWKGEPFAFHIRGELHRKPIDGVDGGQVLAGLNAVLDRVGCSSIPDGAIGGSPLGAA